MEPEQFGTGTKLLVLVKELELTQHFLGEDSLFSLLESEIQITYRVALREYIQFLYLCLGVSFGLKGGKILED